MFRICRMFAKSPGVDVLEDNALDPQLTVFPMAHSGPFYRASYNTTSFSCAQVRPTLIPSQICPSKSPSAKVWRIALICWQRYSEAANQSLAAAGHSSSTAPPRLPAPAAFPVLCSCGCHRRFDTPFHRQILVFLTYRM